MGYVYAFSALGFIPIEIEIYNARVVMGTRKKKSDGEYMYKFNEMDLDKPDYSMFSKQIIILCFSNSFQTTLIHNCRHFQKFFRFQQTEYPN